MHLWNFFVDFPFFLDVNEIFTGISDCINFIFQNRSPKHHHPSFAISFERRKKKRKIAIQLFLAFKMNQIWFSTIYWNFQSSNKIRSQHLKHCTGIHPTRNGRFVLSWKLQFRGVKMWKFVNDYRNAKSDEMRALARCSNWNIYEWNFQYCSL